MFDFWTFDIALTKVRKGRATIDVNSIKQHSDCRQIVEHDLGQPKTRAGTYSTFKCPFHNERKGYSLVVYAHHWRCLGKCGTSGDVISWLMRYHRLSFRHACESLAVGNLPYTLQPIVRSKPEAPSRSEPPGEKWQKVARRIVEQAEERLWRSEGRRALAYLKNKRGLSEEVIATAQLGYIPGPPNEWKQIEGLKIPCGITIPWYADGALWGIKVRRAAGEQRYQQMSGGNIRGCLYLADRIEPGLPLFLTEGELDALTAWQIGWGKLCVASIGSVSNRHINLRWHGKLFAAPRLLVCMDADEAGERAASEIANLSLAVKIVQVPIGKDVNEFYRLASEQTVRDWLKEQYA
jgi:DNA primase